MRFIHDSSTYSIHLDADEAKTVEANWIAVDDGLRKAFSDRSAEWWIGGPLDDILYIRVDDPPSSDAMDALTVARVYLTGIMDNG